MPLLQKVVLLAALFLGFGLPAWAQTGPGGVGNANGTSGQPENVLWVRPDGLPSGPALSTWTDDSGNGRDLFNADIAGDNTATPSVEPSVLNGFSTARFSDPDPSTGGDGSSLDSPALDIAGTSGFTYFVVVDVNGDVTPGNIDNPRAGDGTYIFDRTAGTAAVASLKIGPEGETTFGFQKRDDNRNGLGGPVSTTDANTTAGNFEIVGIQRDATNAYRVFVDGDEEAVVADADGDLTPPNVRLGAHKERDALNGDIAEFMAFGDALNAAQVVILQNYLAAKYGLTLASNDRYAFDANHGSNVAGIGQTGGESHTEAESAAFRISNPASLSDGDFVLFGHDDQAFSLTTSERPRDDNNARKVQREWRVDLTGASTQTVDVEVDVSSLSLPSGFDDFGIFVDSDGDGDFSTGSPDFYPLDGSNTASNVSLADGDYVTVGAVNRTVQFASANASGFENDGGDTPGDAFAPALEVELNYASADDLSIPFEVAEGTSTLVEDETTVSGRDNPDYRRSSPGSFTIPAGTTTLNFNTAGGLDSAPDPALEIVNDARDAVTNAGDESSPEDIAINLTGTFPTGVSAGGTSTLTFEILDDDDPRKISFAGAGGKPVKILRSNPQENNDTNSDDLSDDEGAVNSVQFEVALPEGVEGSPATFAVFEISGADVSDFDIPDNPTQNKLTDRRGEVQVNNTQQVNSTNTGYGTFTIDILDDGVFESDETITIELVSARSGTIDQDPAANLEISYTILNDDAVPTVSFSTGSASGDESVSTVNATLELSGTAGTDLDVDFSVAGAATGGGDDYTQNISSPITIPAGQTNRDITFSVADDTEKELGETIEVIVTDNSTTDANVGSPSTFTYTIVDNDGLGSVGPGGVGDVTSNRIWLRADAITTLSDGDDVETWADVSGNENNAVQNTASQRPTFESGVMNGMPVIRFADPNESTNTENGDGDYLDTPPPGIGANSGYTYFVVVDLTEDIAPGDADDGDGTFILDRPQNVAPLVSLKVLDDDTNAPYQFGYQTRYDDSNGLGAAASSEEVDAADPPSIVTMQRDTGTEFRIFVDGVEEETVADDSSPLTPPSLRIGSHAQKDAMDGDLPELIVFEGTLNTTQRTIVQNYLSAKYDVDLNTGNGALDVYTGDTGGNGDFDRGVFGIGRASAGDFHSAAQADGLRLDLTTGFEDGDYLLAGHATPTNSVNTADISGPTGLAARMDRTWYVDATNKGSALTVSLTFDLSDAGLAASVNPDPSGYVLLYRNSQSGPWSTVSTGGVSTADDQITFSGVSSASEGDGYYTLGTTNQVDSPISGTAITVVGNSGNEGDATVGELGGDAGWRMIGPPVEGATAGDLISGADTNGSVIEFTVAQGSMFYRWDDTISGSPNDGDWSPINSASTAFQNGRGYLLFLFDDDGIPDADPLNPSVTLDVATGMVTSSDVTVGDGTPASDPEFNRNAQFLLLANPFNEPYDLTSLTDGNGNRLGTTESQYQATVQIWDGGATTAEDGAQAGSYVTADVNATVSQDGTGNMVLQSGSDVISAWQGFFVERRNPGGGGPPCSTPPGSGQCQLTFKNSGITTGDRRIVGSKSAESDPSVRLPLKLTVTNRDGQQIARDEAASIHFHSDATVGWDGFDASKLQPLASTYAVIGPFGQARGDSVTVKAVESRPRRLVEPVDIPIQLQTAGPVSGEAEIATNGWDGVPEEWTVTLIDTRGTADPSDDAEHVLAPESPYTFDLANSTSESRSQSVAKASNNDGGNRSQLGPPPRIAPLKGVSQRVPDRMRTKSNASTPPARFRLRVEPGGTIPVEFAGIEAVTKEREVTLTWTTASETNNAGFTVEHRRLRTNAAGDTVQARSWNRLGFVEGTGTTDEPQAYRYKTGPLDYGPHAFRLRQVDTDGSMSLSDEVQADVRLNRPYDVSAPYPHPVRRATTVDLTVRKTQSVAVDVYDVLGRRVAVPFDEEVRGQQTRSVPVDASRFASGVYFLRIRGETFRATERMTVVH